MAYKPTIDKYEFVHWPDDLIFVHWKSDAPSSQIDRWDIHWWYKLYGTNDAVLVKASEEESPAHSTTWNVPANWSVVTFEVCPVAKTNSNGVAFWSGEWSSQKEARITRDNFPPLAPPVPSYEKSELRLKAFLNNIDSDGLYADSIEFSLLKWNGTQYTEVEHPIVNIVGVRYSTVSFNLQENSIYRLRARSIKGGIPSATYSDTTDDIKTRPSAPYSLSVGKGNNDTSLLLKWSVSDSSVVDHYTIEYTTVSGLFDTSSDVQSVDTTTASTSWEIGGLSAGNSYYFRIRSVNYDNEVSQWSSVAGPYIIGETPNIPTTWSSTTTATVGEPVKLYWLHNSKDSSKIKKSKLWLQINSGTPTETEIVDTRAEKDKDKPVEYVIDTEDYTDGAYIAWKVATAGISDTYSDYSVTREIKVYNPSSVSLTLTYPMDESGYLTAFPINIEASVDYSAIQHPIAYTITIVPTQDYEILDNAGRSVHIGANSEIYYNYITSDTDIDYNISAGDVNLRNNITYLVYCSVTMSSGLSDTTVQNFTVAWDDITYDTNCKFLFNDTMYSANITPYAINNYSPYSEYEDYSVGDVVSYSDKIYECVSDITHTTYIFHPTEWGLVSESKIPVWSGSSYRYGQIVKRGTSSNYTYYKCIVPEPDSSTPGQFISSEWETITTYQHKKYVGGDYCKIIVEQPMQTIYFIYVCKVYETSPEPIQFDSDYWEENEDAALQNTDVLLSVYRREYDGSFTELATDIDNERIVDIDDEPTAVFSPTTILDPHPSLDYARYRIVAKDKQTGVVSFNDLAGYPVNCPYFIIQWDEQWQSFTGETSIMLTEQSYDGSILVLPYNIEISDSHKVDVTMVEYSGRENPVTYYGTQIGHTSVWKTDIPATDKETLYAIRRLAKWTGDVYVREPSGTGYNANITVSYSQKYNDLVIPITFDVTKVEGGI